MFENSVLSRCATVHNMTVRGCVEEGKAKLQHLPFSRLLNTYMNILHYAERRVRGDSITVKRE